ncbi:cytochrome P450 [Annulohypoxylon bovei var. microspora]|nr:cytochrome P450 [Annulohypoxylon bovei var. microspora]
MALTAVFFYLSHLDAYQKLAAEIRFVFSSSDEIRSGPQLAGCLYLRACIGEALRMSPSVVGTLWREEVNPNAKDPLIINGHATCSLSHNPKYFPDPFQYWPDWWLETAVSPKQETVVKAMQGAFAAFFLRYRRCAGKSMAYPPRD